MFTAAGRTEGVVDPRQIAADDKKVGDETLYPLCVIRRVNIVMTNFPPLELPF